jgi:formylmethanofuran dehydrogenase subunit E
MTRICSVSLKDYQARVAAFHGHLAPGMVLGGFMVDLALRHLPPGEYYDALCETPKCLPDAIQLLTPCTIGNGWLKVVNLGRYALILYRKPGGEGVRVFVDPVKLEGWPAIKDWFFKLKPKTEQDLETINKQIEEAGSTVCRFTRVRVKADFFSRRKRGPFAVCPKCRESYPASDGTSCLACQGQAPFQMA